MTLKGILGNFLCKMQKLAVIDFDKTLISVDCGSYFIKEYKTLDIIFLGILRKLGLISRTRLSEKVSKKMNSKLTTQELKKFVLLLNSKVNNEILDRINVLQSQDVRVIIVSASPNIVVEEFCKIYKLDGYGSYNNSRGEFRHLYRNEKLKFVKENFPKTRYEYFFTVGDSYSDRYLFNSFENSFLYKNNKLIKVK